jgi:hypothetical protein
MENSNKKKYHIEDGHCPFCAGDNIEYNDHYFEGDYLIYYCSCDDCNRNFRLYYQLLFDGVGFKDDEENFCEFDAFGHEI